MTLDFNTFACEGCVYFQQELQKQEQEHKLNFVTLKQKIISTDLIIKKYHEKCQELECQKQRVIALSKQNDQLQRDVLHNEIELRKTLQDLEQMQKTKNKLEALQKEQENQQRCLQEQLTAAQHSQDQYKAALQEAENAKEEEHRKRTELQRKFQLACLGKNESKESQKHNEEMQKEVKNLKNKITVLKKIADSFSRKLEKKGLIPKNSHRKLKKYFKQNDSSAAEFDLFLENAEANTWINSLMESVEIGLVDDCNDEDAEKLEQMLIGTSDKTSVAKQTASKVIAEQSVNSSSEAASDSKVKVNIKHEEKKPPKISSNHEKTVSCRTETRSSSHNFESVLTKIRRFTLDVDSVLSPLPPSPYQTDEEEDIEDNVTKNSQAEEERALSKDPQCMDESVCVSDKISHSQFQHQLSEGFSVDFESYETDNIVDKEDTLKLSPTFVKEDENNKTLQTSSNNSSDAKKLKRLQRIEDDLKIETPVISKDTSLSSDRAIKAECQKIHVNESDSKISTESQLCDEKLAKEHFSVAILDEHNYSATDNDLDKKIEDECFSLLQTLIATICETKDINEIEINNSLSKVEIDDNRREATLCTKSLVPDVVSNDSPDSTKKLITSSTLEKPTEASDNIAEFMTNSPELMDNVELKDKAQVCDVSREPKHASDVNVEGPSLKKEKNKFINNPDVDTREEKDQIQKIDTNSSNDELRSDELIQKLVPSQETVLSPTKHSPNSLISLQSSHCSPSSPSTPSINSGQTYSKNDLYTQSDSSSFSPPLTIKPLSPLKSPADSSDSPKADISFKNCQEKIESSIELTIPQVLPSKSTKIQSAVQDESHNSWNLHHSDSAQMCNITKSTNAKKIVFKQQTLLNEITSNVSENKTLCFVDKQSDICSEVNSSNGTVDNKDVIGQPSFKFNKKTALKSYGGTKNNLENVRNKGKRCLENDLFHPAKHLRSDSSHNNSSDEFNKDIPVDTDRNDSLIVTCSFSKVNTDSSLEKELVLKLQNEKLSVENNKVLLTSDEKPVNNSCDVSKVEFSQTQKDLKQQRLSLVKQKKLSSMEEPTSLKAKVNNYKLNSEQTNKDNCTVLNKDVKTKPKADVNLAVTDYDKVHNLRFVVDDKKANSSKPGNSVTCQMGKKLKSKKRSVISVLAFLNKMPLDISLEDWENIMERLSDCTCPLTCNYLARRIVNHLKTVDCNLIKEALTSVSNNKPFPVLTVFEQKYLYLVHSLANKYQLDSLFIDLFSLIIETIFISKEKLKVFGKATLCRFYTSLCRLQGNLEQARVFCYDLFRNLNNSGVFVTSVIGVWPSVINGSAGIDNILCDTFQFLLLKKGSIIKLHSNKTKNTVMVDQIHQLIKAIFPASFPEYSTEKLTSNLLEKLAKEIKDRRKVKEILLSLELIAVTEGWEWTNNILIRQKLWPILQKWSAGLSKKIKQGKRINKSEANSCDKVASLILQMMGILCHLCPRDDKEAVLEIMKMLKALLQQDQNTKVPWCIEEAAVEAILLLEPYDPKLCKETLANWPSKDCLSPEIQKLFELLNY